MKNTTLLYLLLALLNIQAFASTQNCEITSNNNFEASYEITTPQGSHTINYYRLDDISAFEYTQQGITEVWKKTLEDKAFLVRGFDSDKRSIEYEVIDLSMEHKNNTWKKRNNFMNPEDFNFKSSSISYVNGCKVRHYTKETKGKTITMNWNEKSNILVDFELKENDKTKYVYKLTSFKKINLKNNHVKNVQAYDRTDFADIGDNESDPFFRKMINLGFVAHHETNIINENGQRIEMQKHSH